MAFVTLWVPHVQCTVQVTRLILAVAGVYVGVLCGTVTSYTLEHIWSLGWLQYAHLTSPN